MSVDPILLLLLNISLRACVLLLIAAAVLRICRVHSAAAQHAVWAVTLAGMGLLVLSPMLPPIHARVFPPQNTHHARELPPHKTQDPPPDVAAQRSKRPRQRVAKVEEPGSSPVSIQVSHAASKPGMSPGQALSLAYMGGVVLFLGQLAAGYWVTLRLVGRSRPVSYRQSVPVHESPHITVPMTLGWLRPKILLPECWREWDSEKLNAALAHEREHVRRHDWAISLFAALNRSMLWFHPAAWWIERRLAALAEEACDDAAVLALGDSAQYAHTLLDMARAVRRSHGRMVLQGVAMARETDVRGRIERVLDDTRAIGRPLSRRAWRTLTAIALPLAYLIAALQPARMVADTTLHTVARYLPRAINSTASVESSAMFYANAIAADLAKSRDASRTQANLENSNSWVIERAAAILIESGLRVGAPGPVRLDWDQFPALSEAVSYGVALMKQAQTAGEGGIGLGTPDPSPHRFQRYGCDAAEADRQFYFTQVKPSSRRVELLRQALDNDPNNVFLNRWLVLSPNTDLRREFQRKLEHNPNDPRFLYFYGEALAAAGDQRIGLSYFEKSAKMAPDFPWNYLAMAHIHSYGDVPDQRKLIEDLKTLSSLCPNEIDYRELPRIHDATAVQQLTARYRGALETQSSYGIPNYYPRLWSQELRLVPASQYRRYAKQVEADMARIRTMDPDNSNVLKDGLALASALKRSTWF